MSMPTALRKQFLLHARKTGYKKRVAEAIQYVKDCLAVAKNPYVAVSGGKDSSVLLHLCRSVRSALPALIFYDPDATPTETESLFKKWEPLTKIQNPGSLTKIKEAGTLRATWEKQGDFTDFGHDGFFYGLRAEEGKGRRKHAKARGALFRYKEKFWTCQPLLNWIYEDVWAYIVQNDVPYNSLYDLMWDQPRHHQRVGLWSEYHVGHNGRLAYLKMTHPDIFSKITKASKEFRELI